MIRWLLRHLQLTQVMAKLWLRRTTASVNGDCFAAENFVTVYCQTFFDFAGSVNHASYYWFCAEIDLVRRHCGFRLADFQNSENGSYFSYGLLGRVIDCYSSTFSFK